MSGGAFDYKQYNLREIAETILLRAEEGKHSGEYSRNVIGSMMKGVVLCLVSEIYAQRIDWLLSGDDGEDNFQSRLREELSAFPLTNMVKRSLSVASDVPEPENKLNREVDCNGVVHIRCGDYRYLCNSITPGCYIIDTTDKECTCKECLKAAAKIKERWVMQEVKQERAVYYKSLRTFRARPMVWEEYVRLCKEDPTLPSYIYGKVGDRGYLVEDYANPCNGKHKMFEGIVYWCPEHIFDKVYKLCQT